MAGTQKSGPPTWDAIAEAVGPVAQADIQKAITSNVPPKDAVAISLGIRHYIGWLTVKDSRADTAYKQVLQAISGARNPSIPDAQYVQLIATTIRQWFDEAVAARKISPITCGHYGRRAADVLEWLGTADENRYPAFESRLVTFPKHAGDVKTLGSLGWPEVEDLKGAARERRALNIVRGEAARLFLQHEKLFAFGQRLLSDEATQPDALLIKDHLLQERQRWTCGGEGPSATGPVLDIGTWVRAGLDRAIIDDVAGLEGGETSLQVGKAISMALGCLGPTLSGTMALMVVFCCDTGWNRQPILDLPRHPFVYRSDSEFGLGLSAFIESFKNRAGHAVLAHLEQHDAVAGMALEQVKAAWRKTSSEFDASGSDNGHCVVRIGREGPSLLDLLDAYERMADEARKFDHLGTFANDFFLYLTPNHGLYRRSASIIAECFDNPILSRSGIGFRSVRKTWLSIQAREVGSVSALRPLAGHTGHGVLMPHYLNTPDMNAELDESIRFFQNACQSLLIGNSAERRVQLQVPDRDVEWFLKLAEYTGIRAASSDASAGTTSPAHKQAMEFAPTKENLAELYLLHRALKAARRQMPRRRWTVQGMPLLALVKAIGRTICSKGMRPAYASAARAASRDIRDGLLALPVILED